MRGRRAAAPVAIGAAVLAYAALVAPDERGLPGFSPSGAARELGLEERFADLLDPERTAAQFRYLTKEPHPAGSERNRRLAEYVRDRFVDYGLEEVEIHEYQVLLPQPRRVRVAMLEPRHHETSLR